MVQNDRNDLSPTHAEFMAIEQQEALERGIEKGIEQGIGQGLENGKKSVALALLSEDFEVDYIAKLTGLSVIEIEKMKKAL